MAEYSKLKSIYHIDVQIAHSFPTPKYTAKAMNYKNINANEKTSTLNYNVTSAVDFAKLFLQKHMAKFSAFNETCDVSTVLNLLERVPIFSGAVQNTAYVVRESRNKWGHCNFIEWDATSFKTRFGDMENLVKELKLAKADEDEVVKDLNDWEKRGMDQKYALFYLQLVLSLFLIVLCFANNTKFICMECILILISIDDHTPTTKYSFYTINYPPHLA